MFSVVDQQVGQILAEFSEVEDLSEMVYTLSANLEDKQDALKHINVFTWTISLIAVLIGGVGVMNTVLMSVFERTREFGVLRAVGWQPRQVLAIVLGEVLAPETIRRYKLNLMGRRARPGDQETRQVSENLTGLHG